MMKDSMILGMILGAMVGIVLMETCKPVQKAVEQGKEKVKESVIFPRYHQLDVVTKILADVINLSPNGKAKSVKEYYFDGTGTFDVRAVVYCKKYF